MGQNSKIEWTEATWNPVTGCDKVSQGCKHCYAERMAKRLKKMGNPRYKNEFKVTLHSDLLTVPWTWRKPRMVFVNSMSDLFHHEVPFDFIDKVFAVMACGSEHIYQILTKRPSRMKEYTEQLYDAKRHVCSAGAYLTDDTGMLQGMACVEAIKTKFPRTWLGTSIEDKKTACERIPILKEVQASIRFLSIEPLLGPIDDLDLSGIHWVIVGGESGPLARRMRPEWVRSIRDQCEEQNVPFFFKQWGGVNKKLNGRELDRRTYDEFPLIESKETSPK